MTTALLQTTRSAWRRMTGVIFGAAALVLLVASASPAAEPAIVVSVRSFDELFADVQYLADVVNQALPHAVIGHITAGQGFEGLDRSRPIGAYVTLTPQGQPQDIVVFVPVSNQDEFAASLANLSPDSKKDGELTQYQFPGISNPILGKAGARHFFFSSNGQSLKETADPAKLVTATADISMELDLTRIPDSLKEIFLVQVEAGAAANARENPSQTEGERKGHEVAAAVLMAGM